MWSSLSVRFPVLLMSLSFSKVSFAFNSGLLHANMVGASCGVRFFHKGAKNAWKFTMRSGRWGFSISVWRAVLRFEGPIMVLSLFVLSLGLFVVFVTDGYVGAWVGMEINMLGFMCYLGVKSLTNLRVLVDYFVFQSLGSTLFLYGVVFLLQFSAQSTAIMGMSLLHLGLLCKAGLFPFWVWVPAVVNSSGWFAVFLLLGIQKGSPLVLLNMWCPESVFLCFVVVAMSILGGVGGAIQHSYRDVLVYSSFVHSAWMCVCLMYSQGLFLFYMSIYVMQLGFAVYFLFRSGSDTMKSGKWSLLAASAVLSLSGLPPLAGFVVKMIVIFFIGSKFILVFPLMGSMLAMYFYMKVVYNLLVKNIGSHPRGDDEVVWFFLVYMSGMYACLFCFGVAFL